jgi:DNA-binding transcriptional ArsR family regulator
MMLGDVMALLDRATAQEYASWFRALADPTRVQLVELLARTKRPMSVGELVEAIGLAQSTVSQHLKILAEVRFVLVDPVGTARHYRINENCVACFPTAADVLMGRPAPTSIRQGDVDGRDRTSNARRRRARGPAHLSGQSGH